MASVSSLDHDMRKLRLDRYTPGAANETRKWIEDTLGELLEPGDLMEALRDGVALCKLINRAVSPGVKYKSSNMPFVQMENISHFLKACEMPPLNLPAHDRFLTVDLYDKKDPAQVLQCIAAFSRRANMLNSTAFPTTIGAKVKGASVSPQGTGSSYGTYATTSPSRPAVNKTAVDISPANTFNSPSYPVQGSPTKKSSLSRGGLATGGPVSSWSSKDDEGKTAPAWNIHQYGYMGGASQGNQGISFGGRRQITSAAPEVPSFAEKEKRLREKLEKEKLEMKKDERRRKADLEAEEARAKEEEERQWAEETRRIREQEEQDRRREEDRLRREEQARRNQEAEARMVADSGRQRTTSDPRLNGQFLSQYQAGQGTVPSPGPAQTSEEARRIAELERQLAQMKQQNAEREFRDKQSKFLPKSQFPERSTSLATNDFDTSHEDDWAASERDHLQKAWKEQQEIANEYGPPKAPRPQPAEPAPAANTAWPLSDPVAYQPGTNRTERYLSSNPAPAAAQPRTNQPSELGVTTQSEQDAETARRVASQNKTKAGGWASKSLLEREMERERERQREWEEHQKSTASAARDFKEGSGPGQSWDVHQYGYMGGDNQNRGGPGLGVGGARRQIIGPRPPP